MSVTRNYSVLVPLGIVGIICLVGICVHFLSNPERSRAESQALQGNENGAESEPVAGIRVKTIRPKLSEGTFTHSLTQPAFINPLYQAELMSHVAGDVKRIDKNIGDLVTDGEVLIEVDVPELMQEVSHKRAMLKLAQGDVRAAEASVAVAAAAVKTSKTVIAERKADVDRALANKRFREAEFKRIRQLGDEKAIVAAIIDERQRDFEAAEANAKSAEISVDAAIASSEEVTAKAAAAKVDLDVKKAKVAVADADLARSQAIFEYTRIKAPFDGMIIARNVDRGDFIQNATTGKPISLLTLVKTDIVTAVMWVPEKEAPLVNKDTEVTIRLDAVGTREIHGHITRLSNWLDPTHSRDMRVEVDLRNLPDRVETVEDKSDDDTEQQRGAGLLRPGMYGSMTLTLQKFDRTFLVPASAVFERGKRSCLFEVADGHARLTPVRVVLEDGVQAKVAKIVKVRNQKTGEETDGQEELSGREEIILSGQGEIADGQKMQPNQVSW